MNLNLQVLGLDDTPDTYDKLINRLDIYDSYLKNASLSSNEGMGTGLVRVFIGITDVFLRIGNTFKTNVFKFHKSLKRSEMRYFSESHTLKCKNVESQPYDKFFELKVDLPSGLIGTMTDGVIHIIKSYNDTNLASTVASVQKNLIAIRRQISRSEEGYKDIFQPMSKYIDERTMLVSKLNVEGSKLFTDKRTDKVRFMLAYQSMQDFKNVRRNLLEYESALTGAKGLVSTIDELDLLIADITDHLRDEETLDIKFVQDLSKVVRYLASAFDLHGVTMSRQMALEHNHILNINTCYENNK